MKKHIDNYLSQFDSADAKEKPEAHQRTAADRIAWMRTRITKLKELGKLVEAHPDKQISTVDPDARLLKTQGMKKQVCYNVQT
ncbi:MAG: hypothetical protein ACI9MS_003288 [Glaciecola sp.]